MFALKSFKLLVIFHDGVCHFANGFGIVRVMGFGINFQIVHAFKNDVIEGTPVKTSVIIASPSIVIRELKQKSWVFGNATTHHNVDNRKLKNELFFKKKDERDFFFLQFFFAAKIGSPFR